MIEKQVDVIVVGAGLSGLIAALTLQNAGCRVKIIEKRSSVGGLCGSFVLDGFEFATACNDFGCGLVKLLKKLGVDLSFEHKKSLALYRGEWFDTAPGARMLTQFRHDWKNLLSLLWGVLLYQLPSSRERSIEAFVDRYTGPGPVNDLAKMIAYFMGVAPYDIKTSYFGLDGTYDYGYTKLACPVGGPKAISDEIANKFEGLGGKILLDTTFLDCSKKGSRFFVNSSVSGEVVTFESNCVINTIEDSSLFCRNAKRGLPISVLCLAIDEKLEFPKDTHTLIYYEPGFSDWFGQLDQGIAPENFGFHVFKSDLRNNPEGIYTLNVYFYLPRGVDVLDDSQKAGYSNYLVDRLDKMIPNIRSHIVYKRLLAPADYLNTVGLSSRVMPYIGVKEKPANATSEAGFYHAGHTVYPPGEHAGAAALSGHLAAKQVMAYVAESFNELTGGTCA